MRLYLLSSAATRAEELRFSDNGVKNILRQTLFPLWNAYNFLVTYALVDKWSPEQFAEQPASQNLLDRWLLSKTASLVEAVDYALSNYKLYAAIPPILDFVDQLTNWYIRLNRRRFWVGNSPEEIADKYCAYATLYRVLLTFARILAPLAPFTTEEIFKNLSQGMAGLNSESVHLNSFPTVKELGGIGIEPELEQAMEIFEKVILLGRTVRNQQGLKVRQPLAKLTVIYPEQGILELVKMFDTYLKDELNIKNIEWTTDEAKYVSLKAQLNTKLLGAVLGPKFGAAGMQKLSKNIETLSSEQIWKIEKGGSVVLKVGSLTQELSQADLLITRTVNTGIKATASSGRVTISLDTTLSSELRLECLAREFVNRVQKLRKASGFEVADRIIVKYMTACPQLTAALEKHRDYVAEEILAVDMLAVSSEEEIMPLTVYQPVLEPQEINGKTVIIGLSRIQA
jgi:isoleucyl-tRNA synthetase